MASLTQDTNLVTEPRRGFQVTVKNAQQMYAGAIAAVEKSSGTLKPNTGAAGDIIVGLADGTPFFGTSIPPTGGGVLGDTTQSVPPAYPMQRGLEGGVLENVAVTGASALTNFGDKVYMNNDDHTFTRTRPTRGVAVGFILVWKTGTTCDIFLYSAPELLLQGFVGGTRQKVLLGLIDFHSTANGTMTTWNAPFHGKIMSTYAVPVIAPTGSGGTVTVQPQIGGVSLTTNGGLATLATGDAIGTNDAGAAVTDDGTNEFHEGDAVSILAASAGGTRTTGLYEFWAIVEPLPGA